VLTVLEIQVKVGHLCQRRYESLPSQQHLPTHCGRQVSTNQIHPHQLVPAAIDAHIQSQVKKDYAHTVRRRLIDFIQIE